MQASLPRDPTEQGLLSAHAHTPPSTEAPSTCRQHYSHHSQSTSCVFLTSQPPQSAALQQLPGMVPWLAHTLCTAHAPHKVLPPCTAAATFRHAHTPFQQHARCHPGSSPQHAAVRGMQHMATDGVNRACVCRMCVCSRARDRPSCKLQLPDVPGRSVPAARKASTYEHHQPTGHMNIDMGVCVKLTIHQTDPREPDTKGRGGQPKELVMPLTMPDHS